LISRIDTDSTARTSASHSSETDPEFPESSRMSSSLILLSLVTTTIGSSKPICSVTGRIAPATQFFFEWGAVTASQTWVGATNRTRKTKVGKWIYFSPARSLCVWV
jgi:hypothetical protein